MKSSIIIRTIASHTKRPKNWYSQPGAYLGGWGEHCATPFDSAFYLVKKNKTNGPK